MLAPICTALGQLAPISPSADTVAAVLAMARREAAGSFAEAEDAAEDLAAVRALYDESPPEALAAAARAEADVLAPICTALGQLAPVSPPADTVAAVLAMARREAQATKPPVSALAPPAAPRRPAADRAAVRPPANPSRRRFRIGLPVLGLLAAGIALVVALGPGTPLDASLNAASEQASAEQAAPDEAAAIASETGEQAVPQALADAVDVADAAFAQESAAFAAAPSPAVSAARAAPAPAATVMAGAALADDPASWNVTDDMPALALRVQALQAAGELEWEDPPVALGSGAALDAAPAPAAGWMQVRMDGSGQ